MMKAIKFFFANESLRDSPNGNVTGVISLNVDGLFFPEEHWNDNILTIMNWWIDNFIDIIISNKNVSEFHFMDGPFSYCLCNNGKGWILSLETRTRNVKTSFEINNIDIVISISNYINCVTSLLESFELKGFFNRQVEILKRKNIFLSIEYQKMCADNSNI